MEFKDIKNYFEDNHKLVILLITVMGSAYQIINLLSLSTESVKFFSITTALSDSIITSINILIMSILVYIFMIIIGLLFNNKNLIIENYVEKTKSSKFYKKYKLAIYFLLHCLLRFSNNYFNINEIYFDIILIVSFIVIFYIFLYESIPNMKCLSIKEFKNYYYLITIISFLSFPFIFPKMNQLYDKEIYNLEIYKTKLLKQNEFISVNIKYFNDKYLFIIVQEKKTKKEFLLIKEITEILENK